MYLEFFAGGFVAFYQLLFDVRPVHTSPEMPRVAVGFASSGSAKLLKFNRLVFNCSGKREQQYIPHVPDAGSAKVGVGKSVYAAVAVVVAAGGIPAIETGIRT